MMHSQPEGKPEGKRPTAGNVGETPSTRERGYESETLSLTGDTVRAIAANAIGKPTLRGGFFRV